MIIPGHWGPTTKGLQSPDWVTRRTASTLIYPVGSLGHLIEAYIKPASKQKPSFQHFQCWKGRLLLRVVPYPVNKSHVLQQEKYWWEVHIFHFKARSLLSGGMLLKASDLTGELSSHSWNNFTLLWFCLWFFSFFKIGAMCLTLIRTIKALKKCPYNLKFLCFFLNVKCCFCCTAKLCLRSTESTSNASSEYSWNTYHVPG